MQQDLFVVNMKNKIVIILTILIVIGFLILIFLVLTGQQNQQDEPRTDTITTPTLKPTSYIPTQPIVLGDLELVSISPEPIG